MSRTHLYVATGLSAAGLLVGGLASLSSAAVASPAAGQVAPPAATAACPAAYPGADLVLGQEANGLTTAGSYRRGGVEHDSSTTPEEFTGRYRGRLVDPSGDLFIFELEGSRITKADGSLDAGIWAGISGSPLYADDGRLIGSVSYSFSSLFGTTFAGVTPAADLYALLGDGEPAAPAHISLSKTKQQSLIRAGLPPAAARDGLHRLAPETMLAGVRNGNPKALARIAKRSSRATPMLAGGSGAAADPVAITPGSNFAAADSYGAISFYSVGTTTAVCGDTAIAYGHPADFAPSRKSVHGATTTIIQADGASSYKLANLAAPAGTLTGDHLAGITAQLGPVPDGTTVTTSTTGAHPRNSLSHVVNPDALAFVVANQTYLDAIMTLDQDAGGEGLLSWTISYKRANGSTGTFTRSQRYSTNDYLAEALTTDVAADVDALVNNPFEDVTITSVHVNEALSAQTKTLKVGSVQWRKAGEWRRVPRRGSVPVTGGKRLKIRVNLVREDRTSSATPTSRVMTFKIPKKAARRGEVEVTGNNISLDDWFFEEYSDSPDSGAEPKSFDQLLASLKAQPRQDSVTVTLTNPLSTGQVRSVNRTWRAPSVVSGDYAFKVINAAAKKPNKKPRG